MAQIRLVVEMRQFDLCEFGSLQWTRRGEILKLYELVEAADVFKYAFADVRV